MVAHDFLDRERDMSVFSKAREGLAGAVLGLMLAGPALAGVGFQRALTESGLSIGLWYPSEAVMPEVPNTPFGQALARGAMPAGEALPLVVISHGNSGWMGGHAPIAYALAEAGFVVAAPTHSQDSMRIGEPVAAKWMVSRPQDIVATLDFVTGEWRGAGQVDTDRIGMFGFSAGGYTALVAGGAVPDIARGRAFCGAEPEEFVCRLGIFDGLPDDLEAQLRPAAADGRIGALVLAAPGLAFAFDPETLSALELPVQIWSGSADERVPTASNAAPLADALPDAELHEVAGAGHFFFLAPCDPRFEAQAPEIWEMACVDAPELDRVAFQAELAAEMAAFFAAALPAE